MDISNDEQGFPEEIKSFEGIQDFREAQDRGSGELWYMYDSGAMLGVFISHKRALLLYLFEEGDSGMHPWSADDAGDENVTIRFVLTNGQRDTYPYEYTVTLEEARRSVEYFNPG